MQKIIFILILFYTTNSLFTQTSADYKGKKAVITTEFGDIEILLYDGTPKHRDNFIKLAKEGFYDGLLFHRIIKDFVIQGGDPVSRNASKGELLGGSGPGYTIPAEINSSFYHKKGAIAAARQGDQVNPQRASSGSQFYIVTGTTLTPVQLNQLAAQGGRPQFTEQMINDYTSKGGTPHLDGAYTVFGEVIKGIEIVEKLGQLPTDAYNRPNNDIRFRVKIIE